jgi:hypothetical protein
VRRRRRRRQGRDRDCDDHHQTPQTRPHPRRGYVTGTGYSCAGRWIAA